MSKHVDLHVLPGVTAEHPDYNLALLYAHYVEDVLNAITIDEFAAAFVEVALKQYKNPYLLMDVPFKQIILNAADTPDFEEET